MHTVLLKDGTVYHNIVYISFTEIDDHSAIGITDKEEKIHYIRIDEVDSIY